MTKDEKIQSLATSMTRDTREDGTGFYHFTDTAPDELTALFLENYNVRDLDYETFSRACDIVHDVLVHEHADTEDEMDERIREAADESASVWNNDRLAYLNIWNEEDISEMVRSTGMTSIADACAYWYDMQVQEAALVINEWIQA